MKPVTVPGRRPVEPRPIHLPPLPRSAASPGDWRHQAACRNVDPETFFPPEGMRGNERREWVAEAKAVCHGCPVIAPCLDFAVQTWQVGIWAGTDEDQRDTLRKRRACPQGRTP